MLRRALVCLLATAACSRPVATARRSLAEPPSPRELAAEEAVRNAACSPRWGFLFPGLGQLCLREVGKGAFVAGAAAGELTAVIATSKATGAGLEHPAVALPAVALQDLWVYGVADAAITEALARRAPYAPQDSAADLLAAPFNAEVMKRPEVWAGLAAVLALGIGATLLVEDLDASDAGSAPNVLGEEFDPVVGYPLGLAAAGALFAHVGIAEEALFRGVLQSGLARTSGENAGWAFGSLVFGAVHAPNALVLEDPDARRDYLLYALPVITAIGSYLGWVYKESDYSLAPSTAIHFWYDFLLTATFFVLEPKRSPLSAGITIRF